MIKKSKILMLGLTLVFLFSLSVNVTAKDFSDLAKTSWAYNAVSEMTNYGVIDGYTDGTFKPQKHVTRAEFSKLLVATLDIDEDEKLTNPIVFEDVPQTNWAYPYILKAGNYLTGYKVKGKYYFYPSNDAVREDMAVAMVVASGLSNVGYDAATLKKFKDADKITPALQKYVAIAVEHGLMKGNSNGTFNAKGTLTRAEAAQLMVNFVHSEKLSLEDIEKLIKEDGNGPVLHEKYGYIDLGEDYSKYQYTDDETWHTATSRYLHKSSNPKTAQCSNFYGTDIQIREIKNKDKVYSFKVPYVAPIQIEFDKSTNKIDLGENWHAYDICTTDLETLKDAKSGSYKWVKAPERYIEKGGKYFDKYFLYVRYEYSNKSSYTADAVRYGEVQTITWKKSDKTIEYTGTSYKLTEEAGIYYITVGAGKKTTNGYSIEVVDAKVEGRNITISVQQTVPAKTQLVDKVANYPTATIELNGKPDKITITKLADKTTDAQALTWKKSDKVIEYKSTSYKMVEENGKVYIVVGAGSKSTDGYSIEIVDVHINGTEVVLDVQQTVPAKTAIVNKVTNYPTAVIEMNGKPTKITLNKLPDKTADTAALTWKKSDKVIEYKSSGYKVVEENGKVYIVVGAGTKYTDGYSIDVVDVHFNGTEAVIDTQQTVPAATQTVNKVTNYPTCVIELNGKPTKVTLNKLADKVTEAQALTWKKSDKVIEYKTSGYKIVEEGGKIYIVVCAGSKSIDGYSYNVVDVHFNGTEAVIDTQLTLPASTQTVNKVTNYPTSVIELNGKPTKVTINRLADKTADAAPLTWKKADKSFEYKTSGYKVIEENGRVFIVVGSGYKSHGGYSIKIVDVHIDGPEVILDVQETNPAPIAITTQAIEYPTDAIEILGGKPGKVTINKLPTITVGATDTKEFTLKRVNKYIEYTGTDYKLTSENGIIYITVGMGKRSGSGFDITINDWGYGDGHLDLYVQERIPLHPELQMTMPYYPTDTAEINIRPNSVTVHKMDPIYTGDDILPALGEPLTWKTTSKTFNITELYKVNYADGKYYLTVSSGPKSYPFALVIKNVAICDRVVYVEVQEDTANYPNQSAKNFYGCATIELSGSPDAVFVETIPAIPSMDGGEFTWKETTKKYSLKTRSYEYTEADGKIYLTVGYGTCMTGGYSIKIESANLDGDTLYLVCKTSSPRPTDYVTQAITYPSYTIEVSRVIKNVHIEYYSDQQQSIGFTSDGWTVVSY